MKTQIKKFLNLTPGYLFILVLIFATFSSCIDKKTKELIAHNTPDFEIFTVGPEGRTISALNNSVLLNIPEGSFDTEVSIVITKGSTNFHLDSLLLMKKDINISVGYLQPRKAFTLRLNYNPDELLVCGYEAERCLKIYGFKDGNNGMVLPADCIPQNGECQIDCRQEVLEASFSSFGTFVVGRNLN
jgi:hypothetical protein